MDEVAKKKKMPVGLTAEQKELGGMTSIEMKDVEMETARPMKPSAMKGVFDSILGEDPKMSGKENATAIVGGKPVNFESKTSNPSAEERAMQMKYQEKLKKFKGK